MYACESNNNQFNLACKKYVFIHLKRLILHVDSQPCFTLIFVQVPLLSPTYQWTLRVQMSYAFLYTAIDKICSALLFIQHVILVVLLPIVMLQLLVRNARHSKCNTWNFLLTGFANVLLEYKCIVRQVCLMGISYFLSATSKYTRIFIAQLIQNNDVNIMNLRNQLLDRPLFDHSKYSSL